MSDATRWPTRARLALLAAIAGSAALAVALAGLHSADGLGDLAETGHLDAALFVCIGLLAIVALVPASVVAATSGYLFATAIGTTLSIAAVTLGSLTAFLLARWIGGEPLTQLGGERLRALVKRVERRGFLAVLYARLLPGSPFSLLNYLAGLTRISTASFTFATALGFAPRAFVYASIGERLTDFSAPEVLVAVAAMAALAAIGALVYLLDRRG